MNHRKDSFDVPDRLGPCVGLTKIGQGAMGAVFKAHHPQLGTDVAVKVVNPKLGRQDPVMLKRFVREVRLLAAIRDPHVVRVLDAGQDQQLTYAVMELVRGQALDEVLASEPEGRMRPGAAAYYLASVARGLHAVHACGVVHRDLKPENVMVDTQGRTKIADFGLARGANSTQLTMADEVVGTPEYMSPEMISASAADARSDLYSLGIMGYELLTGQTPFNKGGLLQIAQAHLGKEPVPVRVRCHAVPPGLEAVVHRLLAKDPDERYPDALHAAEALQPFADASPPHRPTARVDAAPAPSAGLRLPEWEPLLVARLLAERGLLPAERLLDGLEAWLSQPGGATFVGFLVERARLPAETAQRATEAARQRAVELRNRIAASLLQHSSLPADRLAALTATPPPPGVSLVTQAAMRGLLTQQQAQILEQRTDEAMNKVKDQTLAGVCARAGLTAAAISGLAPPQLAALRRQVVAALIEQLR